jgi:hypothetical protein
MKKTKEITMRNENNIETNEVVASVPTQKTGFRFKKVFIYRASALALGLYVTLLGIAPSLVHLITSDPGQPW